MPRIFVALTFPHSECDQLAYEARSQLAHLNPRAQFSTGADIQMAMLYIGETEMHYAQRLRALLRPLEKITPNQIITGALQRTRSTHNSALLLGLREPIVLRELYGNIVDCVKKAGIKHTRFHYHPYILLATNWTTPLKSHYFKPFTLTLSYPVVMVSEFNERTNSVRYRELMY